MFTCYLIDISISPERTILCFSNTLYEFLCATTIFYETLDGNTYDVMLLCQFHEFLCSHHGTIFTHYLTAQSCFCQSCKAAKIHCCLCMSCAHQYPTLSCLQREHMSWATEVYRFAVRVCYSAGSNTTFYSRDTCCCRDMVYTYRKSCLVVIAIVHHHLWQIQSLTQFLAHRHTYQAFSNRSHKVHILCRCKLRCTDKVALIFAIRVINYQDTFACSQCLKSFFYGVIFIFHFS